MRDEARDEIMHEVDDWLARSAVVVEPVRQMFKMSWFDAGRYLTVETNDPSVPVVTLAATSESYNPTLHRDSTTWNYELDGKRYKFQIQVTDA